MVCVEDDDAEVLPEDIVEAVGSVAVQASPSALASYPVSEAEVGLRFVLRQPCLHPCPCPCPSDAGAYPSYNLHRSILDL